MPNWNKAELEELSPSLRATVESGLARRDYIIRRLSWKNKSNAAAALIAGVSLKLITEIGKSSVRPSVSKPGTTKDVKSSSPLDEVKQELWKNLSSQLGAEEATKTMRELERMDKPNGRLE